MLKITGPYSAADLNWDAPTNIAEVGKRYCIGANEQNKIIEKCCIGGWCGDSAWVYDPSSGCPADTIQVDQRPACPDRSGRIDTDAVGKKLELFYNYQCEFNSDDFEPCRGLRAQIASMLKIK